MPAKSSRAISSRVASERATTLAVRGVAQAGERTLLPFGQTKLAPGRYRFTLSLSAPVNRGEPLVLASNTLTVR